MATKTCVECDAPAISDVDCYRCTVCWVVVAIIWPRGRD